MRKIIFLTFTFFICYLSHSQTVILEQSGDDLSYDESGNGPNQRDFYHLYLGGGFIGGPVEEGAATRVFNSGYYEYGSRYKRKYSNVFSGGFEFVLRQHNFVLIPDSMKFVGSSFVNDWEKMAFLSLGAELFQRINFDRNRGDYMGIFLDIGAGGGIHLSTRNKYRNRLPNKELEKVLVRNLNYAQAFNTYAFGRFGRGRLSMKGSYRFSDLFKSSAELPELPRFWGGLEIGIY